MFPFLFLTSMSLRTVIYTSSALLLGFAAGRYAVPTASLRASTALESAARVAQTKPPTASPSATSPGDQSLPSDTPLTPSLDLSDTFPDWEHLLLQGSSAQRLLGFADKLRQSSVNDLPALAQWLDAMPGLMSEEKVLLYETWATHDPQATVAWLQHSTDSHPHYLAAALHAWATQDPKAAAQHYQSLPSNLQAQCFNRWLEGWSKIQPVEAEKYIQTLKDETLRDAGLQILLSERMRSDPAATMTWFKAQPAPQQAQLSHGLATHLAITDPAAADAFLRTQPSLTAGRENMRRLALYQMQQQGKPPLDWALKQTEPNNRAHALGAAIGFWAQADSVAAAKWLNTSELGHMHDTVIATFALEIAQQNPATAIQWAQSAKNSEERHAIVEQVLAKWHRLNPQAAFTWATSSGYSDAYRTISEQ
jgi:hypothetical protein